MPLNLRTALLPLALALAAVALVPAAGHANPRQVTTFEAPNELLGDGTRDQTLDEIRGFGVTQIRQLVYWQSFAPSPDAKRKPSFDAADPNAYPAGTWSRLDHLFTSASARGIKV